MHYKGKTFNLMGCAWYATVNISREDIDDDFDDKDYENEEYENTPENKVDIYHDTTVTINGRVRRNVVPIKDNVSLEEAENLVKKGILQKYYVWRTTTDSYSLLYAPDMNMGITRLLAIWGEYNEIANERQFKEKEKYYKKVPINKNRIEFSGNYFVLDTSFIVSLSKEETLKFLKETQNPPHVEGKLRTDELFEAVEKWEKENGYFGKILILDEEAQNEFLGKIIKNN